MDTFDDLAAHVPLVSSTHSQPVQWLILFAVIALSYFISRHFTKLMTRLVYFGVCYQYPNLPLEAFKQFAHPFRLLTGQILVNLVLEFFVLEGRVAVVFYHTNKLVFIVALAWIGFKIVDVLVERAYERMSDKGLFRITSMLPLMRRGAKIIITLLSVLVILQNFGVDITALLLGLGVGGLAIALAAQKTIENLFGSVMLVLDQPVRVGDDCKFGDLRGVVEDVGLRSTKIRTPDRTVISVPNSQFSELKLENYTRRDRILFKTVFQLRYETSTDQLRYILVSLKKLLIAHPKVDLNSLRVRLIDLTQYAMSVDIFAYILTADSNEFFAVREDLLLRMIDVIHEAGSGFAIPSQLQYSTQNAAAELDKNKAAKAEGTVRAWRENNELFLPEIPVSKIAKIRGTVKYPPEGSSS